jgi:hypothetical protein
MGQTWWGEFGLADNEQRFWQIGPLSLWARRAPQEWEIAFERDTNSLRDDLEIATAPPREPGPEAETFRYGVRATGDELFLRPATADRPVIVRSASPFFVPPGEKVMLFVSTALWLQVGTGPGSHTLMDQPLTRPTDSWFGPSTMSGELCYAAKTSVRFRLENLPLRPHRAISLVRIRNRADTQLTLEKLKLPLPHLSLFAAATGHLWTERITVDRGEEGESVEVSLGSGPPPGAEGAAKVSGPRQRMEKGRLISTLGALFGVKGAREHE